MAKHHTASPRNHKKPLIGAALALVAAAALIGGPVTSASLNDTTSNTFSDALGGGLAVEVLTSPWETVAISGQPANLTPRGSGGIIPGVRGQKITFTARNSATSVTPAQLTGTITALKDPTLQALEAAGLQYAIVASVGCTADAVATVGDKVQATITSAAALAKGEACTFTMTLSIPCTGTSCESAAWNLKGIRLTSLPAFTVDATLTQMARPS